MLTRMEELHRRSLRFWPSVVLLGLLVTLLTASALIADVWGTWDYPGSKRKLKVWVRGAGGIPGFAAAVQKAMDNWNGSSGDPPAANNGAWELEAGTEADHDVSVDGTKMDGAGGELGETVVTKNKASGIAVGPVAINIDNQENWGPGAAQQDLERAIKHELGHAQRMDDTNKAGDLMNGTQASGNHNVTPSGHDQSEAGASYTDSRLLDILPKQMRQGEPQACAITGVPELGEAANVIVTPLNPGNLETLSTVWDATQITVEFRAADGATGAPAAWHNEGFRVDLHDATGAVTSSYGKYVTTNPTDPAEGLLPHAYAGPDMVVQAGSMFTLIGTGSMHDDPSANLNHFWKWEAGPEEDSTTQTKNMSMSISVPGDYFFTLQVEDDWCRVSEDTVMVTVVPGPPVNDALLPRGGDPPVGPSTFTAIYSDPEGWLNIRRGYVLINDTLAQIDAVFLYYDRLSNKCYLKNDANTSWGTGYAPGSPVVLENSQCFVYVGETIVNVIDDRMEVNWRIELKEPFRSKMLNGYMYVQDVGGLTDGWERLAVYYNVKPLLVSIAPNADPLPIDAPTTLTSVYRDINGVEDLNRSYVLLCENFSQSNAMFLFYDKTSNKVYLKNDTNTSWGPGYAPGTPVVLENSQCSVFVGDIQVIEAGDDRTVVWAFSLKPSQAGRNLLSWMYVTDSKGAIDGWRKMGMHFVPIPPICMLVVPAGGMVPFGAPMVFATLFEDANGYSDIAKTYLQLSVTSSQVNAVLLMYDAKQNKVYLKNDANTSWGTGYAPGSPVILENSQCTVNLADMPIPNGIAPGQLELLWPITLEESQSGKKLCERMYVADNENLKSGWKVMGYVTVN